MKNQSTQAQLIKEDPPELTLEGLAEILSILIKFDWENKLITFLAMLSTYTHDSQLNVSFNAPSSSGKTFITTSLAKLFPSEDKIELMRASPTALMYKEGYEDEDTGATVIELFRKLLIFYELPGSEMQKTLRAIMSHDSWENRSLTTNKDKKGANRAHEVIIKGFPAMIFCSAGLRLDEQEATRAILLSPEATDEKLNASIHFTALRNAGDNEFLSQLDSAPEIKALKERILAIKELAVSDIYIPEVETIERRFIESVGKAKPRHNRDIDHLLKLVKAITLLNVWHRRDGDKIVSTQNDIDQAFRLWQTVSDSQDQNLPPTLLQFYKHILLPAYNEKLASHTFGRDMREGLIGLSEEEITGYYRLHEGVPLNVEYLRKEMLPQLKSSGLVTQAQPQIGDKRSRHIFPQWFPPQNNIGTKARKTYPGGISDPFDH